MKIYEGTIITCDEHNTVARYLIEDKGKIRFIGNDIPSEYEGVERVSLGKKALIPAFADTHIHFASFAIFHAGLNVMEARSNKEISFMLSEFVKKNKDKLIIAFGASPYSVSERKLISKEEIDAVCSDRPVMVVKYDGHACTINSALLNILKDKIKGLRGYNEETGEMQQEAFFRVSNYVTKSVSVLKLVSNMKQALDYMASKGIGMIHTVSGVGFTKDLDVDLERWFGRGLNNGMQLRVFFQTLNVKNVVKRKLPRIGGCFATALDGCYGSQDAAMKKPYEGTDQKGVLYYSDEQVIEFCKKANRANLQIELHAIGDAAFDQATKGIQAALDDYPRKDHRHGIIHACLPTNEGLKICKDYHIQIPLQTSFINWKQEPDEYLEEILGQRCEALNPLATLLDNHIRFSAGSDAPCTAPDPLLWIHNACNHSNKVQAISVYEALRMSTYHGYAATFDEKERGSLEVGKIADMVILSENPFEIEKERLKEIKVQQLYLSGKPYKGVKTNSVLLLLKGMCSRRKI
ncbi:amidohydrolase [Clostridium sp. Marseille-P299]|uniref:amidohydrolase n=1 Tax=Clostridium sp. Marseille-P299 TaxID=1805477 RepID=UPI00082E9480|nr:amidohydrolase family protein [Clostridium sp. Marseille-P299]